MKKRLIFALVLSGVTAFSVEMQVVSTVTNNVAITDIEPTSYIALFRNGVPYKYVINFVGKDGTNVVGRKVADFTPAEAAYILPALGPIMDSVEGAINTNKEMIIQKAR